MVFIEKIIIGSEGSGNLGAIGYFRRQLHEVAPEIYRERGIDFERRPRVDQERLILDFLDEIRIAELRDYSLARQQISLEINPRTQIDINPRNVEIRISEREEPIVLGPKRERMLAFFVALTEEKIYRCLDPLVSRNELTSVVDSYRQEQLYEHLLKPLTKTGFFEVDYGEGYRLSVDPKSLWQILQGNEFSYRIMAEGYKSWLARRYPGAILVGLHQQKMLKAIRFQVRTYLSEDDLLDLDKIKEQTGLKQDQVYKNLQELGEAGIICKVRDGDSCRVRDIIDIRFLEEIVRRQQLPIKIEINPRDSYIVKLEIAKQEEVNFPEVSWGIEDCFSSLEPRKKLMFLDELLTTDLIPKVFEIAGTRYLVRFPTIDDESEKLTLSALQHLGIGPKELNNLLKERGCSSLAAAINALETKMGNGQLSLPNYGLFLTKMKSIILELIFEEKFTFETAGRWKFAEVMRSLEESSSPTPVA